MLGYVSRMANKLSLQFPSRSIQRQEMPFFHLSDDIFIPIILIAKDCIQR